MSIRKVHKTQQRLVGGVLGILLCLLISVISGYGSAWFSRIRSLAAPAATVTVTQDNLQGWLFYNDENDTIDNSLGSFVNGPATPPAGSGSVQISVSGTQRRNLATYQFAGTILSNITELKYSTYNPSAGNGGSATRSGYLQFNVSFDGVDSWQRRLVFLPIDNGTVVQNTWQEWDAYNGGSALWRYSGPTWPAGIGEPGTTPGTTPKSWATILANYPSVKMRDTDSFFGVRVGEPYNSGYTENLDLIKVGISGNTTEFDFERAPTIIVDADGMASATNCNATDPATVTIAAALTAAVPGDTIMVCPGTYPQSATLNLNKAGVTILGVGPAKPLIQIASSIGNGFFVTASDVTLENLEIQKTDLANQTIVAVQGDNFTAENNLIYGPNPGMTWNAAGFVSRAFVMSANPGFNITNNVIRHLRQPAYISGAFNIANGTVSGNNVSGTKGWVVEGGNVTFSNNTWGEPQNQDCDIALLNTVWLNPAFYQPLLALSTANDNAFVCAQYVGGENGRAIAYVDDNAAPGGNGSDNTNHQTINAAIAGTLAGGTVQVAAGGYNEDVDVTKSVKVLGAGPGASIITGPIGGLTSTVRIAANAVELAGFTITRAGNNTADWNNPNLNLGGVTIQGAFTGAEIHNNLITGNRTGIDINNSSGHTIRNNSISNNRTGLIFRNQTDNMILTENFITNNWTAGIVFLDATGGTNSPVQTALNWDASSNNISGNWYAGIEDRQTGGSLPAPGSNLKNFSDNWWGTTSLVVSNTPGGEPGYSAQIPVEFGGTATNPGGAHDIRGTASANIDYSPFLNSGADTGAAYGFQGDFSNLHVVSASPQAAAGTPNNIQEGINSLTGGQLNVGPGTYTGNVDINKPIDLKGNFTIIGTLTASVAGASISPGNSPGIINSGSLSLGAGSITNIELNGTTVGTQYDQLNVTGTVTINSDALLNVVTGFTPTVGNTFTIINNDGTDSVMGSFKDMPEGTVFYVGANSFRISYVGGTGNDVVLTSVSLCSTVSIPTDITTLTGNTNVVVPINVDDTSGKGLLSSDFTFTYDPAVLTLNGITLGSVTSGATLTTNGTSGSLTVSIYQANPFSGAGTLAELSFTAIGAPGTSSPVSFTAFKFNEGTPCNTTSNGLVTITSGTIEGTITYGNALVGLPAIRPVPNVTVNAVGSVNVSDTTDAAGEYDLSGMGAGAYDVTPSKTGGQNNAVTGHDAALIAQHVVALTTLNSDQLKVADVSGAGGVTSFDAALIARYVVSLPNSGSSGNWVFEPTSRNYPNVNVDYDDQDYEAFLMGDVTGNWNHPSANANPVIAPAVDDLTAGDTLAITAGSMPAAAGSSVAVPISIGDTTGLGILSFQFDLRYDPAVIAPAAEAVDLTGTLSDGRVAMFNPIEPGLLKVVVFGPMPLTGAGDMMNLKFNVIGAVDSETELRWENFAINEGGIEFRVVNGKLTVVATSDESGAINGRVVDGEGRGIRNVTVTATDTNGKVVTAMANGLGYFNFGGLRVSETYTVVASSKRHRFTPSVVSMDGNAVDLELIGLE